MIRGIQKEFNAQAIELKIFKYWKENKVIEKLRKSRENGENLFILDGPPFATGIVHVGHARNKVLKDILIRYNLMNGYNVFAKPGFDMHGVSIELMLEQQLMLKGKHEIENYGIEKFIERCREFTSENVKKMIEEYQQMGIWFDWENAYVTASNAYIESVWWSIARAYERGMMVEQERVVPVCPKCETAISDNEVEYRNVKASSVYVMAPLKTRSDEFILVWTPHPWLVTGAMAIAVNPEEDYVRVKVKKDDEEYILISCAKTIDKVLALEKFTSTETLETIKGETLKGLEYIPPLLIEMPYHQEVKGEWVHKIVTSKRVHPEHSGALWVSTGMGIAEFEIGQEYGLPVFTPLEIDGTFTSKIINKYARFKFDDANSLIIRDLRDGEVLYAEQEEEIRSGHCWRCGSQLIYIPTKQWFIRTESMHDRLLEMTEGVKWIPEWVGTGRMYDYISNVRDWCISRQRYWGIPLPVWKCQCGNVKVVDSIEGLKKGEGYTEGMSLHIPWIDRVTFKCEKCGKIMKRVEHTLDVAFETGAASWASLEYPRKDGVFNKYWPPNIIVEAIAQTNAWFFSQMVLGLIAFDKTPFRSVFAHGNIVDGTHHPITNVSPGIETPRTLAGKYGYDALRIYLASRAPWVHMVYSEERIRGIHRTLRMLWNVAVFASNYMELDKFEPKEISQDIVRDYLLFEDKWLLSRLENLNQNVQNAVEKYRYDVAWKHIERFIKEDLSRVYIKVIKERVKTRGLSHEKLAAYYVLSEALVRVAKMLAPVAPHISEEIYLGISGKHESVFFEKYPTANKLLIDPKIENAMKIALEIVRGVGEIRSREGFPLRVPLKKVVLKAEKDETFEAIKNCEKIIKMLINASVTEILPPGRDWDALILEVVPNQNAIGLVYRQWASKIGHLLKLQSAKKVKEGIERGEYTLGIEGQLVRILPNMVTFNTKLPDKVVSCKITGGVVYVDLNLSDDLVKHSVIRNFARMIQEMRKEMKLDIDDFIDVYVATDDTLQSMLQESAEDIKKMTNARNLEFVSGEAYGDYVVEWNLSNAALIIGITPFYFKSTLEKFMAIPGMTYERGKALFNAGFISIEKLSTATAEELQGIPGIGKTFARKIVAYFRTPQARAEEKPAEPGVETTEEKREPEKEVTAEGSMPEKPASPEKTPELPKEKAQPPGISRENLEREKENFVKLMMTKYTIPGLGPSKARALFDAGYRSVEQLAGAKFEDLARMPTIGENLARRILSFLAEAGVGQVAPPTPVSVREEEVKVEKAPENVAAQTAGGAKMEEKNVELRQGYAYIIKCERSDKAYMYLKDYMNKVRANVICVTRDYPEKVKQKYELADVPIIWLSNVGKENAVRPKDMEKLSLMLEQFISKNKDAVILLDGIEYLITNNNFITVLRFIQSLKDQIAINSAMLLIPINPSTMEPSQFNLIEREVDEVI